MTIDLIGEPWSLDKMNRRGVAKFLTKFVDTNPNIRVLNINSPWGSGKTFFLENWLSEQRQDRACVYFNAWETDFTGDAFVSLVSAIRDQLDDVIGPAQVVENTVKEFTRKASKALLAATPVLAKGVVKKITGVELGLVAEIFDDEAFADAAEKAVEKLIESNKETLNIVEDFKKTFGALLALAASTVAAGGESRDVYIFVDELDRCRPTFAIELLERIKHLFGVAGCRFIIATDTVQLGHSIRAIYGAGFGSNKYLKRFFDAEFSLDNSDLGAWIKASFILGDGLPTASLRHFTEFPSNSRHFDKNPVRPDNSTFVSGEYELDEHQLIIAALAKTFESKLRELEKILIQINAVRANAKGRQFHLFWAAYLIFLKDDAPNIYAMAVRGNLQAALKSIEETYTGAKLYFFHSNVSVHDIFGLCLTRYRQGEDAAREAARELRRHAGDGQQPGYMEYVNEAFFDEYKALASYPRLVDLAHSIE